MPHLEASYNNVNNNRRSRDERGPRAALGESGGRSEQ
jgi:hypothetical protein